MRGAIGGNRTESQIRHLVGILRVRDEMGEARRPETQGPVFLSVVLSK